MVRMSRLVKRHIPERPPLANRRAGVVKRLDTGNKSLDEFANRVGDRIRTSDNVGDVFCKMAEVIDDMSEEAGAGVEERQDETKRVLTIGDKRLITPRGYVTEKPVPRYDIYDERGVPDYCQGGEGCIEWIKDYVSVPVYPPGSVSSVWTPMGDLPSNINPASNRSYEMMWWTQQEILREALVMENNKFLHSNIIFCWPRGDGKSFLAVLIQLYKFFNWLRQQIMLGANSREQSKFVHFDIMRDIIFNSKQVGGKQSLLTLLGGQDNVREKEIRFKKDGNVKSLIRSMTTGSGIVSNITGYTFSEIFEMKKPKFFTQLDGSIRNVPNALGVIDSTVSDKSHILYQLYSNSIQGKNKTVFFSYRSSLSGDPEDYMHPHMTKDQLDSYRGKFPFGEFERYFLNTWDAGRIQLFPDHAIEAMSVVGIDGGVMNSPEIFEAMKKKIELHDMASINQKKGFESDYPVRCMMEIDDRCRFVSELISFDNMGMITGEQLQTLTEFFDTDWALLAGVDLGDPLATRGQARSILSLILKGLIGSRTNPLAAQLAEAAPKWIYTVVGVFDIKAHSLDNIKKILDYSNDELGGIDILACERYGAWDTSQWCEERSIAFEPVYPNYDRQKVAFKELYLAVKEGRLKCPPVPVLGSKSKDLFREEMGAFDHNLEKKVFGSPEKFEKGGIQDDSIYATAWALYGGRDKGLDDFRPRKNVTNFGLCYQNKAVLGKY